MAYWDDFPEDRRELLRFLGESHKLLEDIASGRVELKDGPALPSEIQPLAKAAFAEYAESLPRTAYRDAVYLPDADTLRKGGLLGKQLALKLQLVERLRDRLTRLALRKWLLRLLDAIDNALDSFVAVTGLAHALKELKDTFRGWIDEGPEEEKGE